MRDRPPVSRDGDGDRDMSMNAEAYSVDEAKPSPGKSKKQSRLADIYATLFVVGLIFVGMQVASGYVPPFIMPAPKVVLASVVEILTQNYSHILITVVRIIAGLLFAMVVGVLLGLIMGTIPKLKPFVRAMVIIDTGIPALSWMLLAVFWFREPEARIFFILSVILIPFYALNVHEGIRAMQKELIDMIESFRPSKWHMFKYLLWPWIVPYIFMTTKSIIGFAIRMAIFAELLGAAIGVGAQMGMAQATFRIDQVLAWTVLLVILNLSAQALVQAVEKLMFKWRPEVEVR